MERLIRARRKPLHAPALMVEALESRVMLSYTFSLVTSFRGKLTGSQPQGLVMDGAGNFFGVTATGGAKGYGTVFKFDVGTGLLTTLATFTGPNGLSPRGNLVLDGAGNLFGTTVGGGAFNLGTIFEVAAGTASTITTLASFSGANGAYPVGGLVADASGNLFGTTIGSKNAGLASTVFELGSGSGTITVLATFKTTDQLAGSLAVGSDGTIFGTTRFGGSAAKGSIFQIASGSHALTTRASFNGVNGTAPDGALLLDAQGNLTGLTAGGGASGVGTLFKLPATSSTITTLANFSGNNGQRPIGQLVTDMDGNIFGVTATGGGSGAGVVFERPATSSTLITLHTFNAVSTGTNPTGPLVIDALGGLWGVTYLGGATDTGTLFKLRNNSTVFSPPPPPVPTAQIAGASSTPALRLVVTQVPGKVGSGQSFVLVIKLENGQGVVVNSSAKIGLALGSGPAGGVFGGTRVVSFVKGVATFSSLKLTGKGSYTIWAASEGLGALTGAIVVT